MWSWACSGEHRIRASDILGTNRPVGDWAGGRGWGETGANWAAPDLATCYQARAGPLLPDPSFRSHMSECPCEPWTEWLINNRHVLLTALEAGKSRTLALAGFLVADNLSLSSPAEGEGSDVGP